MYKKILFSVSMLTFCAHMQGRLESVRKAGLNTQKPVIAQKPAHLSKAVVYGPQQKPKKTPSPIAAP